MMNYSKANGPIRVRPGIQNYAWGMGPGCFVHKFAQSIETPKPAQHFAEAWFGDHPSCPATLNVAGSWVNWGSEELPSTPQLPILVKVLSVAKPLSIQAHPSKADAQRLHREQPEVFPDARAKLEASIAISEVELLIGFRDSVEIIASLENVPELAQALGLSAKEAGELARVKSESAFARTLFERLMRGEEAELKQLAHKMAQRLSGEPSPTVEDAWIVRCLQDYPAGDSGFFCFYLLRLLKVAPGQSVFIPTGVPHAYLCGELVEVMRSSDNVLRGGLTNKRIDRDQLLRCIDFDAGSSFLLDPSIADDVRSYRYPGDPFQVTAATAVKEITVDTGKSGNILLSLDGAARITAGSSEPISLEGFDACYVPASCSAFELEIKSGLLFCFS